MNTNGSLSSRFDGFRSEAVPETKPILAGEDSDKVPEVMDEKRKKRGLLRRGYGRLFRALFRCVIPCYPGKRRRRGRRDPDEERDMAACPVMAIRLRDDECCACIGIHAVPRKMTLFSMTTGRMQTTIAGMIVARTTVCRYLSEDGLLTRPRIAAWSQWMTTENTISICRVESTLVFVAWAQNFWANLAISRLESQLADVPFVPRQQRCNLITFRGHFGYRPTQEAIAVEIQEIQDQPWFPTSIVRADGLRIPRQAFTGLNAVNWLITVCRRMSWPEPTYLYACNEIQHVVECRLVTPDGRTFESIVMDTTKRSANRRAALIILGWVATVIGDAPTRRWGELYGSDVCGADVTNTAI